MIQATSQNSFKEEKRKGIGERQALILRVIHDHGPITDKEIAERLHVPDPNFVRPRRFELMDAGLIEIHEKRKCRCTGKTSIAWIETSRTVGATQKDLAL